MDEKALFAISCGLYVVGVKGGAWPGGCIVDALIQATAVPATLILCCVARSNTNAVIKATGEFSVSVLREDVDPFVIANFGFVSAKAVDKWANVPWEPFAGLPVLKQAAARYVCRARFTHEMGSHTLFHCDIPEAEQGEGLPLSYGYYRAHLKDATVKAFQAWKSSRQ
jgi:flavin reductase (DIM6/NTAB) family NADH-FMN oxidoreductase RutF